MVYREKDSGTRVSCLELESIKKRGAIWELGKRPTAPSPLDQAINRIAPRFLMLSLRYNPQQIAFYARLRARQPSGKPGVMAVMRKLLVRCYSLWKNDCAYDPHYHPAHLAEKEVAPTT